MSGPLPFTNDDGLKFSAALYEAEREADASGDIDQADDYALLNRRVREFFGLPADERLESVRERRGTPLPLVKGEDVRGDMRYHDVPWHLSMV